MSDPDETALLWDRWLRQFGRKVRFFRVTEATDKLDALYIYGGDKVEQILDTVPDPEGAFTIPTHLGETLDVTCVYHKALYKVQKHFSRMANKDSARSQFDGMSQGDRPMAENYIQLKKQAAKCQFTDEDDMIRTKILQSMNDRALRREAMLKNFTLAQLLRMAANKEDVERQAKKMEN